MARHPLTARAAALLAAALLGAVTLAALMLAAAGCSAPTAPSPPAGSDAPPPAAAQLLGSSLTAATSATTVVVPAGGKGSDTADPTPTGNGWQLGVLDAVPEPPRLLALPADFTSPLLVAAVYLGVWCYAPAGRPANSNLADTAPWMTAAGWADDATRAVDEPTWARTAAAGVSTVCGPVTASVSRQAPATADETWVGVTAQQARVQNGRVIGQGPVSMVRRILRAADGRWLVDVRVMAG